MSSEIDIYNLALSRLGDDATVSSIDPPEGSAQAEHCVRFYPIARDAMLEMHNWKFATRRAVLAALSVETWDWGFAYAEPANTLKILAVLPIGASSTDATQSYDTESGDEGQSLIYTNQESASVRFIARVTDTTKYSPLFVDALAWLLASHLAGTVIKGSDGATMAKSCMQYFMLAFGQAKTSDANQRKIEPVHNPAWMAGR